MIDWNAARTSLDDKLDPKHVKPAPKGKYGNYIEGWHAIAEANRIFGYGGWSYAITGLTKDSVEEVEKQGRDGPYKQWQAAYTCIVRVTVGDVVREDVGFGSGFSGAIGDAIEGATKEAVTDALKRCLRTFGNPFGLALYDKTQENVGKPQERPNPYLMTIVEQLGYSHEDDVPPDTLHQAIAASMMNQIDSYRSEKGVDDYLGKAKGLLDILYQNNRTLWEDVKEATIKKREELKTKDAA